MAKVKIYENRFNDPNIRHRIYPQKCALNHWPELVEVSFEFDEI